MDELLLSRYLDGVRLWILSELFDDVIEHVKHIPWRRNGNCLSIHGDLGIQEDRVALVRAYWLIHVRESRV